MIEAYRRVVSDFTAPGGGFAMTEIEVRGVPMRVFETAPLHLRAMWEVASLHGDRPYVVFEDETYSYAEIDARVRSLAHHLRDRHGVGSGDRVALAMRNYPEWVIGFWAVVSTGAAVVGMNAWWTGPEMEFALRDSRPRVLICDDERLERVTPLLDGLRAEEPLALIVVRHDGDLPDDAARWSDVVDPSTAPEGLPSAEIDPDDDATIFYTSGTTGTPKGAQLTHRGSVHNVLHVLFLPMALTAASAAVAAERDPTDPTDPTEPQESIPLAFMAPTPLFHVTACNCLLQPATLMGAKIVFTRKWDAGRALELIERERVTNFSGVPTMSRELLMHPDWESRDTSSLKGMTGGGAPMQKDLVDKIERALPSGTPGVGYGLTETTGILTANSALFYLDKPESCGPLVPTVDAKVVDDSGREVPVGEVGVLWVRGPVVVKGYLNRPEATAEAIQDGWFNTGDIARIDEDGFVFIVDRAKDMVLRGGENVYCSEVETAIYAHPAVAESAVFGIPDERLGEEVAAAVVVADGAELDADGLRTHLEPLLARYKIPAAIWFVEGPLPTNANGKVLKRELRDVLTAGGESAG